jgi:hypothetical protein
MSMKFFRSAGEIQRELAGSVDPVERLAQIVIGLPGVDPVEQKNAFQILLDRLLACPEKLRQQRRAARHPRRNVIAVSHVAERAQREIVHEGIMVHCNPLSHSSNQSDILLSCPTRSNFSLAASVLIWCVRVNRILCTPGIHTCLAPRSFAGLGTGKVSAIG